MRNIFHLMILTAMAAGVSSCSQDINEGVDFVSPRVTMACNTFEVSRGETVDLNAVLTDESGVAYVSLEYSDWNIKTEEALDAATTGTYTFNYSFKVPDDAMLSWQETYTKHDGTKFDITQCYHKIALTCYDGVRNQNTIYFYVKVKE